MKIFTNLPIERKLLLVSVIPVAALIVLSWVTFTSVQHFSDDEDRLNKVYHIQTTAAEYMRLVVDLETGFRGFVLTKQLEFLKPYLAAKSRVLSVGKSLKQMVAEVESQVILVDGVQTLIQQLLSDKDRLIDRVKTGYGEEALEYIESGTGRTVMLAIREEMARFDRNEVELLRLALINSSADRSFLMGVILGGGLLAFLLMLVPLHLIGRSITGPLVTLAKSVTNVSAGGVPDVPIVERGDEIGSLTRSMHAMSVEIKEHIQRVESSKAELRNLNQSLSESESKYRGIVDNAPFGIFTTVGTTIIFSNRHNWFLAGQNPDESQDPEKLWDLIHGEDRERVKDAFKKSVASRAPFETVFRFMHDNGTVRKVLARAILLEDGDNQQPIYQGFNVDITALEQMRSQLNRTEKLATLGQVAAGIAHEIRNPLVGIGSTASILLDEIPEHDEKHQDLATILKETRRLDRIVNQIVDYARPREFVPGSFSVTDLLHEVLEVLRDPIKQGNIQLEEDLNSQALAIEGDRDQLKQVFLNILQNAIEALPDDGGTVGLRMTEIIKENSPGVQVEISDTGNGIKPVDLQRVFEPFFTTGKRKGTGLGLAICRNLIEAHHGDIQIHSEPEQGTRVSIWIPFSHQSNLLRT